MTAQTTDASLVQTFDQVLFTALLLFFRVLTTKLKPLVIVTLWLTACAVAPVQEMSDARQAISSAEAAGAAQYSPNNLNASQRLLFEAQKLLRVGAYDAARQFALESRDQAIKAREQALQARPAQFTQPVTPPLHYPP